MKSTTFSNLTVGDTLVCLNPVGWHDTSDGSPAFEKGMELPVKEVSNNVVVVGDEDWSVSILKQYAGDFGLKGVDEAEHMTLEQFKSLREGDVLVVEESFGWLGDLERKIPEFTEGMELEVLSSYEENDILTGYVVVGGEDWTMTLYTRFMSDFSVKAS